jgi:hypothetical protein
MDSKAPGEVGIALLPSEIASMTTALKSSGYLIEISRSRQLIVIQNGVKVLANKPKGMRLALFYVELKVAMHNGILVVWVNGVRYLKTAVNAQHDFGLALVTRDADASFESVNVYRAASDS